MSYSCFLRTFNADDDTCSGQAVKFDAYINNQCVPLKDSDQSFIYNFPSRTTYSGITCQGVGTVESNYFYTTCQAGSKMNGALIQGMNPTPRPTTNYQAATAVDGNGSNNIGLGVIAAITIVITGVIGVIFLLGFFFATKATKRSASIDGNELTTTSSNPLSKE
jgi:hypothetical protein